MLKLIQKHILFNLFSKELNKILGASSITNHRSFTMLLFFQQDLPIFTALSISLHINVNAVESIYESQWMLQTLP